MKEKIQKYLAGEREGFSLVELIIVIAIMAILIGVVTLAVLPNIAKSKESKDITALDTLLSAVNNAVASQQVSTTGNFTASIANGEADIKAAAPLSGDAKSTTVRDEVVKLLGKEKLPFASSKCQDSTNKVFCGWTFSTGTGGETIIKIKVAVQDSSGNTVAGDYMGNFEVEN